MKIIYKEALLNEISLIHISMLFNCYAFTKK